MVSTRVWTGSPARSPQSAKLADSEAHHCVVWFAFRNGQKLSNPPQRGDKERLLEKLRAKDVVLCEDRESGMYPQSARLCS